jgi:small subunit ribosomal protein S2
LASSPLVRELLDAGVHFGHRCSRWNPKMKPYIYGRRNEIHIIDIRETLRGLLRARKFIARVVSGGEDVLFVGTKRQAREIVREQAERCKMHYVCERWLGGTLTNFRTIRSRLARLEELEALVASPEWETGYSKKMKSMLGRELKKIRTNLEGIRRMNKLPGALVVIDVRKEINAVREAAALGVPTICLIDTDSDPDQATIAIPGNDDAMRAISTVLRYLADAVAEGLKSRPEAREEPEQREPAEFGAPPPRRRPRRAGGGGPRPEVVPIPAQGVLAATTAASAPDQPAAELPSVTAPAEPAPQPVPVEPPGPPADSAQM